MSVAETFHGYVETTKDSLLLFEACRRGILPRVRRRLQGKERHLIQSGAVFCFDESESGVKRWTDGLVWSPSRILGNFLIYRELKDKRQLYSNNHDTLLDENYGYEEYDSASRLREKTLVGSLRNNYKFKKNGLIKKSMSLVVNGIQQHLISYYSKDDVLANRLQTPSCMPQLSTLEISSELLACQNFRVPLSLGNENFPRIDERRSNRHPEIMYHGPLEDYQCYQHHSQYSHKKKDHHYGHNQPNSVAGYIADSPFIQLYDSTESSESDDASGASSTDILSSEASLSFPMELHSSDCRDIRPAAIMQLPSPIPLYIGQQAIYSNQLSGCQDGNIEYDQQYRGQDKSLSACHFDFLDTKLPGDSTNLKQLLVSDTDYEGQEKIPAYQCISYSPYTNYTYRPLPSSSQ